jgi:hypothetical protein
MKNLALAASVVVLVAISGQAFAKTAAQNARDWSSGPSGRQTANAYDAFDSTIAAQPDESDAYRYHGGPKYND